jgi:5'-nucleotidase
MLKIDKSKSYVLYVVLLFTTTLFLLNCTSNTPKNKNRSITFIGTADLQGIMEPYKQDYDVNGSKKEILGGGISKIASILKEAKRANPLGTFIISSGDDLMGRYFHTFKGEAIYSLMSQSTYELYAPGNHEFDKGSTIFANALEYGKFHTICSDLIVEDTVLEGKCLPYKILNKQGVKIGFFSLMTEDFSLITSAEDIKLKDTNLVMAQKMIKTLKNEKCDVIVAITHIGLEQDKALASKVKGIDVIFGGHSHQYTKELVRIDDTLIVNGGEQGAYVVKLNLALDNQLHIKKDEAIFELIPVIASTAEDKEVNSSLQAYKAQLPATTVLGNTTVEWDLTTDTLRESESNVADLISDLLQNKFSVDIVMNNAGAFRGKKVYPAGDITDTMLHEIDEFSNNVYIMDIEGKYLQQVLEHSAASYGRGGLMQVAGIYYTIDLSKQAQKIEKKNDGSWIVTQVGERVTQVSIQSKDGRLLPLEESKKYKVLSNAYLVNHAGDGYFWFGKYGTNQKNTYTTFYTIMAEYAEKYSPLNPKPLDGRLKITHKENSK